jgi:putative transposase
VKGARSCPRWWGGPDAEESIHKEQVIAVLKSAEAGQKVADLCRKHGISEHTFYRWRAKYGGMEVGDARKLRALEDENRRLKTVVADLTLDNQMLKAVVQKKW